MENTDKVVVSQILERPDMCRGTKPGDEARVVVSGRKMTVKFDGARWRTAKEEIVLGM